MHMADALISPAVGGALWAVSAGAVAFAANKLQREADDKKIPLMGVLGAFIFAAQMINFTIPGTGSSGHLVGGLLLSILLGPHAAFLTLISVLAVQALFFADGGLLALGCNIFNMAFYSCYIAYPLLYKPLAGKKPSGMRLSLAAVLAAVVSLQLGAFSVVLETTLSDITALPFSTFVLLMQPIHLAIGLVEGLITAAVLCFLQKEAPSLLNQQHTAASGLLKGLLAAALLTAGVLSWTASANPDGLEWSIAAVAGEEELTASDTVHELAAQVQKKLAIFPDYNWPSADAESVKAPEKKDAAWASVDSGTSVAGAVGVLLTLGLIFGASKAVRCAVKH